MTGAVTIDQVWTFFGVLSAAGGIVAGLLAWLWRVVSTIRRAWQDDIAALRREVQAVETDLAEYKQHAAEHFASRTGVSQQIGRLEEAVRDLSAKVDRSGELITARIDRLLEQQAHAPPSRPTSRPRA